MAASVTSVGETQSNWFRRLLILLLVILVVAACVGALVLHRTPTPVAASPIPNQTANVGCLGRIEPQDGVMTLGARSLSGQPSLVAQVLVNEGDEIQPGQVLAFLNSRDELLAQWKQAEANISLSQARLEQVQTGAKPGDLKAQEADVARLKAELANAETENRRREGLFESGVTSKSDVELSRTQLESARQQLQQSQQRLNSLSEVRQVDVTVADAEVQTATADALRAKAAYEASVIRSPFQGHVIKIHTFPGEEVGEKGIMEIAKNTMYVFAEVPEEDVRRVKVGERATVTADSVSQPMYGTVEFVAMKVARDDVLHIDPASLSDTRVVEAKIRLDQDDRARFLINARVKVVIKP